MDIKHQETIGNAARHVSESAKQVKMKPNQFVFQEAFRHIPALPDSRKAAGEGFWLRPVKSLLR
jgi:hypothetical protein